MQSEILGIYERISALTGEMLAVARAGDWERLVALERDCSALIAHLPASESEATADPEFLSRKAAIIRKVLGDDAEIRLLVEPWLGQLESLLGATRSERRLRETYRPDSRITG